MSDKITKAIIPVAGLGTRFLPLSKSLPKEFFPLVDKPIIQYIIEEVKKAGISEIIFVVSPGQKMIANHFKVDEKLEKVLSKRKKENILKELKDFDALLDGISFKFVIQRNPLGDGHAILQAAKYIKDESVAVSFCDDIIYGETPGLSQLIEIYKTCSCPVIGLKQMPKDELSAYGVPAVEKIANRLFKIKKIVEKPEFGHALSDLATVGKYILTPDVFHFLKKSKPSKRGEIILAEVFDKMLLFGKIIYGYEFRGEWLECGNKEKWLKSFFYLSLRDPKYGAMLKDYLKKVW